MNQFHEFGWLGYSLCDVPSPVFSLTFLCTFFFSFLILEAIEGRVVRGLFRPTNPNRDERESGEIS